MHEAYYPKFSIGSSVRHIEYGTTGTIQKIFQEPVDKWRPYFSYLIKWDNGKRGIVDHNRLELTKF